MIHGLCLILTDRIYVRFEPLLLTYRLSVGTERIANILSLYREKVGASLKNLAGETNPLTKFSSSLVQVGKRNNIF